MVDAYDTPMVDYIEDADMSMVNPSSESWFHHSAPSMEEDSAMMDENAFQATSLEIDMITYEETAEYEMSEATNEPIVEELADTDVYDASLVPSPQLTQPHIALEPSRVTTDASVAVEAHVTPTQTHSLHASVVVPHTHATADNVGVVAESTKLVANLSTTIPFGAVPQVDVTQAVPAASEQSIAQIHDETRTFQTPSVFVEHTPEPQQHRSPLDDVERNPVSQEVETAHHVVDGMVSYLEAPVSHPEQLEELSERHSDDKARQEQNEDFSNQGEGPIQLGHVELPEVQHEGSDGNYIDPPPAILLKLQVSSMGGDQPDFALFTLPSPSTTTSEEAGPSSRGTTSEETLVLLQHRPSLFYEPISAVFEALRQEEYFSHLDDLMDSEMLLHAVDLQLAISEVSHGNSNLF